MYKYKINELLDALKGHGAIIREDYPKVIARIANIKIEDETDFSYEEKIVIQELMQAMGLYSLAEMYSDDYLKYIIQNPDYPPCGVMIGYYIEPVLEKNPELVPVLKEKLVKHLDMQLSVLSDMSGMDTYSRIKLLENLMINIEADWYMLETIVMGFEKKYEPA